MLTEEIRVAFQKRSANLKAKPVSSNGVRSRPSKPTFRSWRAFVINHPHLIFDYTNIRFQPTTQVPRDAQFIIGNQPVVVLMYCDEEKLPVAKGTIPKLEKQLNLWKRVQSLWRRKKEKETLSGCRFLTTEYVYSGGFSGDPDNTKLRFGSNTKGFIEAVGGGKLWQDPEHMGPWEFGSHLALNSLKRQLTKNRHLALAQQLNSTVKWMIVALIVAIVFAILFIRQGS